MITTGTMYRDLYSKWVTYLATQKPISSFFIGSSQNDKELKTQFQSLGNDIPKFTDWLEKKANSEVDGIPTGSMLFLCTGDPGKTRL